LLRGLTSRSCFVSPVVLAEIKAAGEADRLQIVEVLERVRPNLLESTREAEELAQHNIDCDILPGKKRDDALHVAIATVHKMDILVSWNHRHKANLRKSEQFRGVNLLRVICTRP
jgi:hypothetical protein